MNVLYLFLFIYPFIYLFFFFFLGGGGLCYGITVYKIILVAQNYLNLGLNGHGTFSDNCIKIKIMPICFYIYMV